MNDFEISIYFIRLYLLSYLSRVHGGFYPQIFAGTYIFAIPNNDHDFSFVILLFLKE
jgi:hypothetical protein